jgi:hypothetical protein
VNWTTENGPGTNRVTVPARNFCTNRVMVLTRTVYLYSVCCVAQYLLLSWGERSSPRCNGDYRLNKAPCVIGRWSDLVISSTEHARMTDWCYGPALLHICHSSILAELCERCTYHKSLKITEESTGITEAIRIQTRALKVATLTAFSTTFYVS